MHYYLATFDNNGTEYFKTFESDPKKVKMFSIKAAVTHLNIWKKAGTNFKEQAKRLTDFRTITESEFNQATGF